MSCAYLSRKNYFFMQEFKLKDVVCSVVPDVKYYWIDRWKRHVLLSTVLPHPDLIAPTTQSRNHHLIPFPHQQTSHQSSG